MRKPAFAAARPARAALAARSRLSPPAPGSPWRPAAERGRERDLKREAIVHAAARAFRTRGYHNTSLEDVASALNVTKPTIYAYVGSKEELLFEGFRTGVEQIRAAFARASATGGTARERLAVLVRGYAEAIASDFGWCMVRTEDQDLDPALSARIRALKTEVDQGLRRLLREGMADGSFRSCDPKMAAFALAGALNWIAHWHRESAALAPAQIADRFLDVFVLGLGMPSEALEQRDSPK